MAKNASKKSNEPITQKWQFWLVFGLVAAVIIGLLITLIIVIATKDTGTVESSNKKRDEVVEEAVEQKVSDDKTIAYVKKYVGSNLASICGWSFTDKCLLELPAGNKKVKLIAKISASDGREIKDDTTAKAYKVTEQSLPQNSEISVSWDRADFELSPDEIELIVEPVGEIKEVTKTGEMERYKCEAKNSHTGVVVEFIRKNSSSGLQSDSYDIVQCEWKEIEVK